MQRVKKRIGLEFKSLQICECDSLHNGYVFGHADHVTNPSQQRIVPAKCIWISSRVHSDLFMYCRLYFQEHKVQKMHLFLIH